MLLTCPLLALATVVLLQGACALDTHDIHDIHDNCARFLVGKTAEKLVVGGATKMPVHVTQRRGWVPIPRYGLFDVRVVGQLVKLCNNSTWVAPTASPDGNVNSEHLKMYVRLSDGQTGPANMELTVSYFLEPFQVKIK